MYKRQLEKQVCGFRGQAGQRFRFAKLYTNPKKGVITMKKFGVILLSILLVFTAVGCIGKGKTDNEALLTGLHHVKIEVENYGTIELELDADTAPITVTNFINLAKDGFYDRLTFHRIISGFMIQGGDPKGTGLGGSGKTITGEFAKNGVQNEISHKRGVISMARSEAMDSASSQFFIVHQDSPHLDGLYAAFGHVTSGIEVVDAICADTPVEDDNGTVLAANQPIINTITVVD